MRGGRAGGEAGTEAEAEEDGEAEEEVEVVTARAVGLPPPTSLSFLAI